MLTIGLVATSWVVICSSSILALLPYENKLTGNLLVSALVLFNAINLFVCMGEIILGLNFAFIKEDSKEKQKKFTVFSGLANYGGTRITFRQIFDVKTWAQMWSTYTLFDPSYASSESFGFFIDVGNGWSTSLPSLLLYYAMIKPNDISPLLVGCVILASNWQMFYGTVIYFLSYVFNKRYVGHGAMVPLFVLVLNGIWMVFPGLAMYAAVHILKDGNLNILGGQ